MSDLGEFGLIGRISAAVSVPRGVTGIGDDCAIIPQKQGLDTLVTTDLLIEGRHFIMEDIGAYRLGWKSAAVNISDIAAMGGKPAAAFLSIALPKGLAESCASGGDNALWIDGFIRGFSDLCDRYGVALLGGDTSASPSELFINVTVLGECPHGAALRRCDARPGDIIYVSGPLGDAGTGLRLILERAGRDTHGVGTTGVTPEDILIRRHYMPEPRVELGLALRDTPGVHAMMDISDGIASDLRHILEESSARSTKDYSSKTTAPGCHSRPDRESLSAEIDLQAIPMSEEMRSVCAERGWDAAELAVGGGEDYELLFTAAPGAQVPEGCVAIGRVTEGPGGIKWIGSDRDYQGFTHF